MKPEKLKVMIADDSVVYRTQIKAALQHLPEVEVVAVAANGRLAIDKLLLTPADLLILDLEMPEMDGIQTLKELNRLGINTKVIVFSSASKRGSEITMEALRLGSSDFITKPDGSTGGEIADPKEKIRLLLEPKIRALFQKEFFSSPSTSKVSVISPSTGHYPKVLWDLFIPKILVIGSSTGGPTVLETIFSQISGPLNCPIVITQHMPPIFTATLAERLAKISGIEASEAVDGEILKDNHIYIAPGNYHLRLEKIKDLIRLKLDQSEQINFVRPAVDPLFQSAAVIFKDKCLGLVLTGMGSDGRAGAEAIKNNGGVVVIQEEKSCIVFGMPGAVHAKGAYDQIATPEEIVAILKDKVAPYQSILKYS